MLDTVDLEAKAAEMRRRTLELCARIGEGRLASSLSAIDLFVALYYGGGLRPHGPYHERDRFILSKGHALAGLYPILQDLGILSQAQLNSICTPGSQFGPYGDFVPGLDAGWGSVGHGLGVGAGMALAAKMRGQSHTVYVMLGDGECYEGSTWEAAMFAAHHGLSNLVAIVDRNHGVTIDTTENTLTLDPLASKWDAFGWEVSLVDGHDMGSILLALSVTHQYQHRGPQCILAETVKGKGIRQLEGNPLAHVIIPSGAALDEARKDLGG